MSPAAWGLTAMLSVDADARQVCSAGENNNIDLLCPRILRVAHADAPIPLDIFKVSLGRQLLCSQERSFVCDASQGR